MLSFGGMGLLRGMSGQPSRLQQASNILSIIQQGKEDLAPPPPPAPIIIESPALPPKGTNNTPIILGGLIVGGVLGAIILKSKK